MALCVRKSVSWPREAAFQLRLPSRNIVAQPTFFREAPEKGEHAVAVTAKRRPDAATSQGLACGHGRDWGQAQCAAFCGCWYCGFVAAIPSVRDKLPPAPPSPL